MRVTETKLKLLSLDALKSAEKDNAESLFKIASGKEVYKPSDDPLRFVSAARLKTAVRNHEQYIRNISDARRFIDNNEAAITKIVSLLQETRMLMVRASNESWTTSDLRLMANEMRQQLDGLIQFANSDTVDGKIFGGTKTDADPFEVKRDSNGNIIDVVYKGNRTAIKRAISEDSAVDVNYVGSEFFQVDPDEIESSPGAGTNAIADSNENLNNYFTIANPATGYFQIQGERVYFDLTQDSLNDIAARINDKVPEVTAEVFQQGANDNRLRITSKKEEQIFMQDEGAARFLERMGMVDGTSNMPANTRTLTQNDDDDLTLFKVIIRTIENLENGEYSEISNNRIDEMSRGLNRISKVMGEIGGVSARLNSAEEREKDIIMYSKQSISENEELDYAKAVTDLRMAQYRLQTAIEASKNMPGQNLLNYL